MKSRKRQTKGIVTAADLEAAFDYADANQVEINQAIRENEEDE